MIAANLGKHKLASCCEVFGRVRISRSEWLGSSNAVDVEEQSKFTTISVEASRIAATILGGLCSESGAKALKGVEVLGHGVGRLNESQGRTIRYCLPGLGFEEVE